MMRREKNNAPQKAVGAGKAAPDKAKKLKKAEGDESPHAIVLAAKAALKDAQKARNEVQKPVDIFEQRCSNSTEISSLMRLANPGRRL